MSVVTPNGEQVQVVLTSPTGYELGDYAVETPHEGMRRPGMGAVPFQFSRGLVEPGLSPDGSDSSNRFEDGVFQTLQTMSNVLEVICFGINYHRYAKFDYLTPPVRGNVVGGMSVEIPTPPAEHRARFDSSGESDDEEFYESTMTRDDAEFCIEFVVESALKVQNFGFNLRVKPDN